MSSDLEKKISDYDKGHETFEERRLRFGKYKEEIEVVADKIDDELGHLEKYTLAIECYKEWEDDQKKMLFNMHNWLCSLKEIVNMVAPITFTLAYDVHNLDRRQYKLVKNVESDSKLIDDNFDQFRHALNKLNQRLVEVRNDVNELKELKNSQSPS